MKKRLAKRVVAFALGCAFAFTSVPYIVQNSTGIQAEAADTDTIQVTYHVQVYQEDVAGIFANINTGSGSSTTSGSSASLKYNSALEKLAVERAKDLALYYNDVRPDGKSGTRIKDDGSTGDTKTIEQQEIADKTPNWTVDTSKYNAAGIGHVKFNSKDYYCLALGNSDDAAGTPDTGLTVPSDVTRNIIKDNISGIYAVYNFNDGSGQSGSTVFTNNNATCSDKMSLTLGSTRSVPTVTYGIRTSSSDYTFPVTGVSASLTSVNDSYISTSGNTVSGKAVGTSSLSYTATIANEQKTFTIPVEVTKGDLANATMTLTEPSTNYYATGKAITPRVNITMNVGGSTRTLTEGTDYKLTYANNNAAATITANQTATITATGQGNYTGTKTLNFTIMPSTGGNLSEAGATKITLDPSEKTPIVYDGKEKKPKVIVTYKDNEVPSSAYDVAYSNNINAGKMTVTVTAKAVASTGTSSGSGTVKQYSGSARTTFDITPADLSTATFSFTDSDNSSGTATSGTTASTARPAYSYTGANITPQPTVKVGTTTLKAGTDFTYSYANNRAIGTGATVTVTGKGNYTGTASQNFEITQGNISKAKVTLTPASPYTYNGQRQYPSVVVVQIGNNTLQQGTDYTISAFPDSVNAGTYSFTITGINNFSGTATQSTGTTNTTTSGSNTGVRTESYTIEAKDASKLYKKDNGISVTGLKTLTYNGKSRKPAISVIDNELGTELVSGTDYTRSDSNNKNPGTASVTLTFKGNYTGTITATYKIMPKKTSITKLTAGKRKATVRYKKVSGISGYQVKAGTNKAVTKGTKTKNTTKTSYTMKSLTKGKKYYFKVRTYYTGTNGKKTYGSWSGVKSVKVK
ncbi:MAG: hypothetical protein PUG04_00110 [Lachnospiraceae bacterium]|nr:hypothetical protein [Lachnospiraceae bacterium]